MNLILHTYQEVPNYLPPKELGKREIRKTARVKQAGQQEGYSALGVTKQSVGEQKKHNKLKRASKKQTGRLQLQKKSARKTAMGGGSKSEAGKAPRGVTNGPIGCFPQKGPISRQVTEG